MTKLEKLYSIIENSKDVGVKLGKDVLQQVEELEEGIIKEEILPALSHDIEPRLEPIRRDLVLVVEYHPGEPISVALSRKVKISDISEAKIMEINPQAEHKEGTKREKPIERKNDKTVLRVTFPSGKVITGNKSAQTFVDTILDIGLAVVQPLNITHTGVPLVSNTPDKKYNFRQQHVGGGIYVIKPSKLEYQKNVLDEISDQLGLGLKVDII